MTADQARFRCRPVKADTLREPRRLPSARKACASSRATRPEDRTPVLDAPSPLAVSRARLDCPRRPQPQPGALPSARHRLPTSATNHEGRARPSNADSSNGPRLARCPLPDPPGCPGAELRAAEREPKPLNRVSDPLPAGPPRESLRTATPRPSRCSPSTRCRHCRQPRTWMSGATASGRGSPPTRRANGRGFGESRGAFHCRGALRERIPRSADRAGPKPRRYAPFFTRRGQPLDGSRPRPGGAPRVVPAFAGRARGPRRPLTVSTSRSSDG